MEAIGVNGLHAIVVAPVLVRVDMLRKGRTYEVLITEHKPGGSENGSRPGLESKILFRGVHGRIELELWGKDKTQAGSVLPTFYSLAGEQIPIPKKFAEVLRVASKAVNCLNCTHSHYLRRPHFAAAAFTSPIILANATDNSGNDSAQRRIGGDTRDVPATVLTAAPTIGNGDTARSDVPHEVADKRKIASYNTKLRRQFETSPPEREE